MNAGPRHRFTANDCLVSNCYGMGWKKFKQYARDTYGLTITDQQAQESRRSYFQMYPRLLDWHQSTKRFVNTRGYVRSMDGQKRRLPAATTDEDSNERAEAERQALNSPVQCLAARINFMALLQLTEEFPWSIYRPVGTVHDSILAEVRTAHVERIARRTLEIMQRPTLLDTLGINLSVPLEGEIKIGPWGSGVDLEKWLETDY